MFKTTVSLQNPKIMAEVTLINISKGINRVK